MLFDNEEDDEEFIEASTEECEKCNGTVIEEDSFSGFGFVSVEFYIYLPFLISLLFYVF